jgi:hypothetical protein
MYSLKIEGFTKKSFYMKFPFRRWTSIISISSFIGVNEYFFFNKNLLENEKLKCLESIC